MQKEKKIYVFADFLPFQNELIGTIYVSQTRGKEFYSFEYEQSWLEKDRKSTRLNSSHRLESRMPSSA